MNLSYRDLVGRLAAVGGLLLCAAPLAAGSVLYVDDDAEPGGDGQSWETAFRFLQDALDAAQPPGVPRAGGGVEEIRVAQGLYLPDRDEENPGGTGDRTATFALINDVSLMGGYAGIRTPDPDARDIDLYETILSGDLFGDDGDGATGHEENSYHVTSVGAGRGAALIDGFTVSSGFAPEFGQPEGCGAGMFSEGGSVVIVNCTFASNIARHYGGGIYSAGGSMSLENCTFRANEAYDEQDWPAHGGGGALWSQQGVLVVTGCSFTHNVTAEEGGALSTTEDVATIADCLFQDNVTGVEFYGAPGEGGGLCAWDSDIIVDDCAFIDNVAFDFDGGGGFGGGMAIVGGSAEVTHCHFAGNWVQAWGGGIGCWCPAAVISDCTFEANSAEHVGGGAATDCLVQRCVFLENTSSSGGGIRGGHLILDCRFIRNTTDLHGGAGSHSGDFFNCTFHGNSCDEEGGAIYLYDSAPLFVNCVFAGNTAGVMGGGIFNKHADPVLVNCTLSANEAIAGGGIYNRYDDANPVVSNCILWANEAPIGEPGIGGYGTAIVSYSDVEEYDPIFRHEADAGPDGQWGTEDDDYGDLRLSAGSPCIDAADNFAVPPDEYDLDEDGDTDEPVPVDLDGNPRFVNDPCTEDTGNGEPPIVDMGAYEFQPPCPCDLDCDGEVVTADLLFLLDAWGTPDGDVDGDGDTDAADLLALLAAWGPCA